MDRDRIEISPKGKRIAGAIILTIIAFFVFLIMNPMVKISAGKRGVVLQWGAVTNDILGEGIHWVWPIVQSVEKMDVTVHKVEREASSSSKDLQEVHTKIALNVQLDPSKVNWVYQNFRHEYEMRVIIPAIDEYLKATTAHYTAEQLITLRDKVKNDFKQSLYAALAQSNIWVRDIFMTDFQFSESFTKAIEEKVTAEQNALREKNVLEQRKYEADQIVVKATAEARAIQIKAQAITQTGGKDYVNLRAVEKWDGKLPVTMIPNGALPFLDVARMGIGKHD